MPDADVLFPLGLRLGESAVNVDDDEFLFVDIRCGQVFRGRVSGSCEEIATYPHSVGAVVPTSNGQLVVAGLDRLSWIGDERNTVLPAQEPGVRMNDGKADPVGRFVGGTMAEPVRPGAGALWSFEGGRARPIVTEVTISNGLCWSADGSRLFYIDTPTQRIDSFHYDLESGAVSGRHAHARIDPALGAPDGMTIDDEGGLWVALWGGGCVVRLVNGRTDHIVTVPTPFVTSVAIVGTSLVITTCAEAAPGDPLAGHVFIAPIDVRGPVARCVDPRIVF